MFKLRELERRDLEQINRWRNDPGLIACLGAPFRFINPEVDGRWYEGYMAGRGSAVRCAVTEDDSDEILALVSLTGIDHLNQSAELHIMVGKAENRGRGVGTFAVNAMVRHAFDNLNLHRVELSVLASNEAARRLYERAGFTREGVKRASRYKNGKFVDLLLYARLREEQ